MALLHNTTFMMEEQTVEEFVSFMRQIYFPELERSQVASDIRLHRIHTMEAAGEAVSLALHFRVESQESLMSLLSEVAVDANAALVQQFGQRVVGFSTVMEEIAP